MAKPGAFKFAARVWRYPGPAGWFFVTLDRALADRIRFVEAARKVGLGYVCVTAKVGRTAWSTTLFPTKEKEYLLALKASVRKAEGISEGDVVTVGLTLELAGPSGPKSARRGGKIKNFGNPGAGS